MNGVAMMTAPDFLSREILAQMGVDEANCFAVSYYHRVGERPRVTVDRYAVDGNGKIRIHNGEMLRERVTYELQPVGWATKETSRYQVGWPDDAPTEETL